ncbi:MAG: hypothetical protein HY367_04125, partial [Candidatus Aenigmarchaeota archaeon]|nr:hypothetical protein [Candidatus Aenigmarchaeota archaeon]
MKQQMNVPIALVLAMLFLPALAAATGLNQPTVSFDSSSLTTGSSKTITVSVSAVSGTSTADVYLDQPTGLSITDPSSGRFNSQEISSSGTSFNFVVTSGTAGNYNIIGRALEQGESSPVSSSTSVLTFIDASDLAVTVTDNPEGSHTSGSSYDLELSVRNPLGSS